MAPPDEMQLDVPEPVVLQQQSIESGSLTIIIQAFASILIELHSHHLEPRSHSASHSTV